MKKGSIRSCKGYDFGESQSYLTNKDCIMTLAFPMISVHLFQYVYKY